MAAGDYRSCDVCGGKVFYDVHLNYETGERGMNGLFVYPDAPFRIIGVEQKYGASLDYLGDWAVICNVCAKTHKTQIVPIATAV